MTNTQLLPYRLQVVSSEPSEGDDLSSLANSDLESCVDASSPRSSILKDSAEGAPHPLTGEYCSVSSLDSKPRAAQRGARSSQYTSGRNCQQHDQKDEADDNSHRNSYVSPNQYLPFEGTNGSSSSPALPSSTTCPELYNQNGNRGQTNFNKPQRNRSDQDLINLPSIPDTRRCPDEGLESQSVARYPSTDGEATRSLSGEGEDIDPVEREGTDPPDIEGKDEDPNKLRAYRIVWELVSTEETYVRVLHLIDQVSNPSNIVKMIKNNPGK